MLLRLLREGSRHGLAGEPSVISLGRPAALAPAIEALGVPLVRLGAGSAAAMPLRLPALVAAARRARPDLVQGWMVHGNLAASAVAPLLPGAPRVAWNVRQSLNDLGSERRSTRVLIRLAARLSRRPAAILYNSRTGAEHHRAIGYAGERTLIVPNGFDLERFRPDPAARERLRAELGVGEAPLVGLVARWDPVKDHAGFLAAMAELSARFPDLRLLLAGSGVDPANDELRALVDGAGLAGRAQLLGERDDVPALLAALDVAVNCSTTEAFANAIGEAMACGVPCAGSCFFLPFRSSAKIFRRGTPRFDHSIKPSCSNFSKISGELRQCLPFGGFIPRHIFPVAPFFVSPGA